MKQCDKAVFVLYGFLLLAAFPCYAAWDLTHPESRNPGFDYDPRIYIPMAAIVYALMGHLALLIYRDRKMFARRQRIRGLIAQTEALIREGRRDEARKTIALAERLFYERV